MRPSRQISTILFCITLLVATLAVALPSQYLAPRSIAAARMRREIPDEPAAVPAPRSGPSSYVALRWAADDAALADGDTSRTWTWGPQIFRSGNEAYAESPDGQRAVWYLDKARMELTHPDADPDDPWFVTSGLLVRELISGQVQRGDTTYESRSPAGVPIAGDLEAPINQTITYADLGTLASLDNDRRAPSRTAYDTIVTETIGKGGVVAQDARLLQYDVHLRSYDDVLGHNIPQVFTDALPTDRLLYIAGRPLTEPYWVQVPVNHVPNDVLVQAFERRVLTYTPANPKGWQVEWGNVGRQYALWRYEAAEDGQLLDPGTAIDPLPEQKSLATLTPDGARIVGERKGEIGVAVLDMTGNILYSSGEQAFPMYSTAKVAIMLAVLNQAQSEHRGVADWEDGLMRVMIQQSDNDAATILSNYAGGARAIGTYLRAIGLRDTQMNSDQWGFSTTTPQDMARLMAKLGDCTILNAQLCRYALELMRGVVPEQRWGIGAGTDENASVALKNGWAPAEEGWTINSVGYVKQGSTRYTIAVYTSGNPSKEYGIATIEGIAERVHAAMQQEHAAPGDRASD